LPLLKTFSAGVFQANEYDNNYLAALASSGAPSVPPMAPDAAGRKTGIPDFQISHTKSRIFWKNGKDIKDDCRIMGEHRSVVVAFWKGDENFAGRVRQANRVQY
jgi:hypothetical protein